MVEFFRMREYGTRSQYAISIGLVALIAIPSYLLAEYMGYRVAALILLMAVSILAMLFDIIPVITAAILSALIWNFFFIPPTFTFHVGTTEDVLMFLMYFVIALINTVLTFKIRETEKKAREKEVHEKNVKLYNTILNSLSHELRTPISTIIGAIDTIKNAEGKLSEHNKEALLTEIEIAGLRLNRHVENLLNMSRLEARAVNLQLDWCDINEMVFSVIHLNKDEAVHHVLQFEPDEKLPFIRIDRTLIIQVLHNIIHNALQHTPPETIIHIEVAVTTNKCRFIITDDGKGFPEREIKLIFDKFYRLTRTKTGGTGLGLSIAKGFTEAHGGIIELRNIPGGGAEFTIEIPVETLYPKEMNDE